MKKIIFLFCALVLLDFVMATTSDPSEFGNVNTTTCRVGGTIGILNCTGDIWTTGGKFYGDGSPLTGINLSLSGLDNGSIIREHNRSWVNVTIDEPSIIRDYNKSWINNSIDEPNIIRIPNSTWVENIVSGFAWLWKLANFTSALDPTYVNLTELDNGTIIRNHNKSWFWDNVTGGEWIIPAYVIDIDDEDIEGDLNTYVDIAGDTMTGGLNVLKGINGSESINATEFYQNRTKVIDESSLAKNVSFVTSNEIDADHDVCSEITNCVDNAWDADGDLSADEISESKIAFSTACAAGNHYYLNGNDLACESDDDTTYTAGGTLLDLTTGTFSVNEGTLTDERICEYELTGTQLECTLVKDGTGTCAGSAVCLGGHAHDESYFTETESNTNFQSRDTWTDHDSYPAACAAATPFVNTIGDTSTCKGVVDDTSPQLGGYLDANGKHIGSTSDEIENVYFGTYKNATFGDGQEAKIYYDGSKLVIKVS